MAVVQFPGVLSGRDFEGDGGLAENIAGAAESFFKTRNEVKKTDVEARDTTERTAATRRESLARHGRAPGVAVQPLAADPGLSPEEMMEKALQESEAQRAQPAPAPAGAAGTLPAGVKSMTVSGPASQVLPLAGLGAPQKGTPAAAAPAAQAPAYTQPTQEAPVLPEGMGGAPPAGPSTEDTGPGLPGLTGIPQEGAPAPVPQAIHSSTIQQMVAGFQYDPITSSAQYSKAGYTAQEQRQIASGTVNDNPQLVDKLLKSGTIPELYGWDTPEGHAAATQAKVSIQAEKDKAAMERALLRRGASLDSAKLRLAGQLRGQSIQMFTAALTAQESLDIFQDEKVRHEDVMLYLGGMVDGVWKQAVKSTPELEGVVDVATAAAATEEGAKAAGWALIEAGTARKVPGMVAGGRLLVENAQTMTDVSMSKHVPGNKRAAAPKSGEGAERADKTTAAIIKGASSLRVANAVLAKRNLPTITQAEFDSGKKASAGAK